MWPEWLVLELHAILVWIVSSDQTTVTLLFSFDRTIEDKLINLWSFQVKCLGLIQFSTDELFSQPFISSLKATSSLKFSFLSNRPEVKRLGKFCHLHEIFRVWSWDLAKLHNYGTAVQCSNLCSNSSPSRWRPRAWDRILVRALRASALGFHLLGLSRATCSNINSLFASVDLHSPDWAAVREKWRESVSL